MVVSTVGSVASSISTSQARSTSRTSTPESSVYSLRLPVKSISALLATRDVATLLLEFVHGDGRELRSSVVLGLVLVDLVDGDCSVDNGRLNSLLLYDGLDVLVHVVVNMLACDGRVGGAGVLSVTDSASISELGLLGG